MKFDKINTLCICLCYSLAITLLTCLNLEAQTLSPNRALPAVRSPNKKLHFSKVPRTKEITSARIFIEPILPRTKLSKRVEDKAISEALLKFSRGTRPKYSTLLKFLNNYPKSRWNGSLYLSLGQSYFDAGYYSLALDSWQRSWRLLRSVKENEQGLRAQADLSLAKLASMYARIGRVRELRNILRTNASRQVIGPASAILEGAQDALWAMENTPEIAFRCGPLALNQILTSQGSKQANGAWLDNAKSPVKGFSLNQVAEFSQQNGLNYQIVKRVSNTAKIIVPSVVHWKLNHYAAIVKYDGYYHVQDPTFATEGRFTKRAIIHEASGYFLIPPGPIPEGYKSVSKKVADTVFGKGVTFGDDPDSVTDKDKKKNDGDDDGPSCKNMGMPQVDVSLMLVSLNLTDTPLGYTPPVGPSVYLTLSYNSSEIGAEASPRTASFGYKWNSNFTSYIGAYSVVGNYIEYHPPEGGIHQFTNYNPQTKQYAPQRALGAVLKLLDNGAYEMSFPDGTRRTFGLAITSGPAERHKVLLTRLEDAAGNAITFTYDADFKLVAVSDANGWVTRLQYENSTYPLGVTKVTDPFNRTAKFEYDEFGRLKAITDVLGLRSSFSYDVREIASVALSHSVEAAGADFRPPTDFISRLTTPYGNTTFQRNASGRVRKLLITYPDNSKEKIEANQAATLGIPISEPVAITPTGMFTRNTAVNTRSTYVWDKKAYIEGADDYTNATVYHFVHQYNNIAVTGRDLESKKEPYENRVWYNYPGQALTHEGATYEGTSNRPSVVGRVLDNGQTQLYKYKYNQNNLLERATDPLGRARFYTYDTNGIDLISAGVELGQDKVPLVTIEYNAQHLPKKVTDASNSNTLLDYNEHGQLKSVTTARNEVVTYEYDAQGFLKYIDGPLAGDSDKIALGYDSFARLNSVEDKTGYKLGFEYDNLNRRKKVTYPDGTSESWEYDKLDLERYTDRENRVTRYTHNSVRQTTSVTDPLQQSTLFTWCDCGSLTSLVDPKGLVTQFHYDLQGRLIEKQYPAGKAIRYFYEESTSRIKSIVDEFGQKQLFNYNLDNSISNVEYQNSQFYTPGVSYTYDPQIARLTSIVDQSGTTTFGFNPAGVIGAFGLASIDGPLADDTLSFEYDELGRVRTQKLNTDATHSDETTLTYDSLWRLKTLTNPLGSFDLSYDEASPRLKEVLYPNGQKANFNYFDNLGDKRLKEITNTASNGSILSHFQYGYSVEGNITSWQRTLGALNSNWQFGYDLIDQLKSVNELADANPAKDFNYEYDPLGNRTAAREDGNYSESKYNVLNQLTSSTDSNSTQKEYTWNAAKELVAIKSGTHRSEFKYDSLGRRYEVKEFEADVLQSQKRFVWCGYEICQERDANNVVVKSYFGSGFKQGLDKYFYSFDHLGSIREVTNQQGALISRYDYAPWGKRTLLTGTDSADFGFTGHFVHQPSNLYLAPFRAYDPQVGRWLSRDPIGEAGGINLYGYARQNPIQNIDPLGLANIFIGGFGDKSTNGPVASYVDGIRDSGKWGQYDKYFTFDQQAAALDYINGLPKSEPINLYGHSYGADTAAEVANKCDRPVDSLTTIDPVSWFRPDFNSVAANTKIWTNINNVGGSSFLPDNIIAGLGGAWNSSVDIPGVHYIESPYSHANFDPSLGIVKP